MSEDTMSEDTIGPTGEHPGKYGPDDKGGLRVALIIHQAENVIEVAFGSPLTYLLATPEEALAFAQGLTDAVAKLREGG